MIYKYYIFSLIETHSSPQHFVAFGLIPQFCLWGARAPFCKLSTHLSEGIGFRKKPAPHLIQPLAGILWGTAYWVFN